MKHLLFVLAWLSFGLGIIGAFLPLLPTTPFLILSGYLFSKSSPRFHLWLLELPYAGPIIKDWDERKVIGVRAKILCLSMLALSGVWIAQGTLPLALKIGLNLVFVSVAIFVGTRKSH